MDSVAHAPKYWLLVMFYVMQEDLTNVLALSAFSRGWLVMALSWWLDQCSSSWNSFLHCSVAWPFGVHVEQFLAIAIGHCNCKLRIRARNTVGWSCYFLWKPFSFWFFWFCQEWAVKCYLAFIRSVDVPSLHHDSLIQINQIAACVTLQCTG